MHAQEVARTRAFTRVSLGLAVVLSAAIPLSGGDPIARRVVIGGVATTFVFATWLAILLRNDQGYSVRRALIFAFSCIVSGYTAIYYFGVFSPAPAVIPFGLYLFSVGQSFGGTLAIYLGCAAAQLGLSLAIVSGLLVDRGLVRADHLGRLDRLVIVALVEAIFFATFVIARSTRRTTISAIEEHDRAVRGLAQRDALLKEARQDLERALSAGGVGRFTDQTLGSFKLGAVLGRGGMGEVYEATHVTSREPGAVKVLHPSALADPEAVRRFLREAKLAASLSVPNVVRVLEIGGLDSSLPYIAMERLEGEDLADLLRTERRLSVAKVLTLLRQVGTGLEAARAAGIVHRDLKPRNLFLARQQGERRVWKILDFGVSKLTGDQGATLTREMVIGTPSYMAPEQASGRAVTHRSDLYSLAVIGYRALTGRPAFTGDGVPEILYKVVHEMPSRPSQIARLPVEVDLVLAIALAKDPAARFDTAAELADALAAAAQGELDPLLRARAEAVLVKSPWSVAA